MFFLRNIKSRLNSHVLYHVTITKCSIGFENLLVHYFSPCVCVNEVSLKKELLEENWKMSIALSIVLLIYQTFVCPRSLSVVKSV